MNIIFLIIMLLATFGIFGLPIWNLARLRNVQHALWLIAPPMFFVGIFGLAQVFESYDMTFWYKIFKPFAYYWLIIGMALFGISVLGMLLHYIFKVSKKYTFWGIIIVTVLFAITSYINGQRIVVKEITLPADYITRPYTFVHITDLHAGSTDIHHAQRVVEKIQPLHPEFMVITGDFIDEYFVGPEHVAPFNVLDFPIYLITGNHEYYIPSNVLPDALAGNNIDLIDGQRIEFEELDIVGIGELSTVDSILDQVGGVRDGRYTIVLDHQPITEEAHRASHRGARLMLSGHTHKGQIWPMGWLISLRYKYVAGLYKIGEMFLYVNQGTGTLGPKMRFGTVNEITHITLEPKQPDL